MRGPGRFWDKKRTWAPRAGAGGSGAARASWKGARPSSYAFERDAAAFTGGRDVSFVPGALRRAGALDRRFGMIFAEKQHVVFPLRILPDFKMIC